MQSGRSNDRSVAVLRVIAALVVVGVLYQRVAARRHRQRFPPPGLLIDVGGHRLHAICRGSGSPVVLLESGIAASSLSWAVVQPEIAKFTRVCAYDRAGLAWSDAASCPRSFDQIVDELSTVLARVAPGERYVLVGHSFGSFVIRAYAARNPEQRHWVGDGGPAHRMVDDARLNAPGCCEAEGSCPESARVLAHIGVVRACLRSVDAAVRLARRGDSSGCSVATAARTLERLVGEVRKLPPDVYPILQALWCQPKCFHAMADHLRVLEREGMSLGALFRRERFRWS